MQQVVFLSFPWRKHAWREISNVGLANDVTRISDVSVQRAHWEMSEGMPYFLWGSALKKRDDENYVVLIVTVLPMPR